MVSIRTLSTDSAFTDTLAAFLRSLEGANLSAATIRAYQTDVAQCLDFLQQNDMTLTGPEQVQRRHLQEHLAGLGDRGLTGVTRARKVAAIRGYFRFLEEEELIAKSPAAALETPKKERGSKTFLRPEEYTRILAFAGTDPRDYCARLARPPARTWNFYRGFAPPHSRRLATGQAHRMWSRVG